MRKLHFLIFFILVTTVTPCSAVVFPSNVTLNVSNADVNIDNLTFDIVTVSSNTISFYNNSQWSNLTLEPDSPINVTIKTWNTTGDYIKAWEESSNTVDTVTRYSISGMPANYYITIHNNNIEYTEVSSDDNGIIRWMYSGGYVTNQTFTTSIKGKVLTHTEQAQFNTNLSIWQTSVGMILVAVVVFFGTMLYQGIKKGKVESDTIILAAKGLLFIAMTLIVGAIILSAF